MDKSLFVAMSSQRNSLKELEMLGNNLANANTTGFRADYEVVKQNHIAKNDKMESRVYPSVGRSYTDFSQGPVFTTGRDLDVALNGKAMLSVQSKSGKEGFTRAGSLQINPDGVLTTAKGEMVMGTRGLISIPKAERIQIGEDGIVTVLPMGGNAMIPVAKLKMVSPPLDKLHKGEDGLFYLDGGRSVDDDPNLRLTAGALEGSNVDTVSTLIKLIGISREYEIHSNFIKNASDQASEANSLLNVKA